MTKRDVFLFLFKWKYSLLGYLSLVIVIATILVYLLPQKYSTSASVLIESNRAPAMRSDIAFGVEQLSVLNSEMAIIKSRTVLSATADKVGLGESTEPPTTVQKLIESFREWLIDVGLSDPITPREALIKTLEDDVKVEPLPNSNVIVISFKGREAKRLAEVVNAVTDSYIDHHLKIFSSKGTSDVFRRQSERLEADLTKRRTELEEFKRANDVSALNETIRSMVQQQSTLWSELIQSRNELAELQTRYGSGHSRIKLTVDKIGGIESELERTREKLQKFELVEAKIQEMEVGIEAIEKSYRDYQKRYEEARLNDLANRDVVNVRVIEYAAVPTRPDHSRFFYILLSIAGGLILTFVIAFIREYFDQRIDDPALIARALGVPILGSVERVGVTSGVFHRVVDLK